MADPVRFPHSDTVIKARTGRDWAEWCAALDEAGAAAWPHGEIAKLVDTMHEAGGWWSQAVTVGYERAHGRAVNQRPGGAFYVTASKTLPVPSARAHACFTDPALRARWLDEAVTIRGTTPPRSVRIIWTDGTNVTVEITAKSAAKCIVAVEHSKLPDAEVVEARRAFWKAALERLVDAATETPA
jgi:hypothetical protein